MKTALDDRFVDASCQIALDGEVVAAYTAGHMSESDAEAFEQHYFACEDCWALVRAATAAQASFAADAADVADDTAALPATRSRRRWAALVPAAALAAAVAGIMLFDVRSADTPTTPGDVFRGVEQTMGLEAVLDGTSVRTRWTPVAGAAGYEIRAYDAGGRFLRASEVDARTVAVDLDTLSLGDVAAVDVVALDGLGQVLRRSERVSLQP